MGRKTPIDASTPIEVGRTYQSRYGPYKIIKVVGVSKGYHRRYLITFLNTGFTYEAAHGTIREGVVKDYTVPSVYGVGFLGTNEYPRDKKVMSVWRGMLGRCYSESNASFPSYGGKGVTVHKDWLNYTTFYNDIPNIPGYVKEEFYKGLLELDKDELQQGQDKKVYSRETTVFKYREDNFSEYFQETMHRDVKGYTPERGVVHIENCNQFAERNGIDSSAVYAALEGTLSGANGWVFSKYDLTLEEWQDRWAEYFNRSRKKIEYRGKIYNSISEAYRDTGVNRKRIKKEVEEGNGRFILP